MVVLNVDDDHEDREFFCDALREIDPSVVCLIAASGMEALALLQDRDALPDYIFLDINMPMMDGLAAQTGGRSVFHVDIVGETLGPLQLADIPDPARRETEEP